MGLRHVVGVLAAGLVLAGAVAPNVSAQRRFDPEWVLLGEKRVGFRVDRDIINIGQGEDWYRDRRFRQLRFVADRNDVHMISIRLVYFNGYAEDFRVDRLIRDGEDLPLDLRGERSYIRRIEMLYRSRPDFRGEAVIRVFGEPARRGPHMPPPMPGPGPAAWVELGCKDVAFFGKDRDILPVGRQEGRFRAIRLHVLGTDVRLRSLVVVYGRGEPDRLPAQHFIRAGEYTPPIDLRGFERSIREVEMVYESIPNFRRTARVCVQGLQG